MLASLKLILHSIVSQCNCWRKVWKLDWWVLFNTTRTKRFWAFWSLEIFFRVEDRDLIIETSTHQRCGDRLPIVYCWHCCQVVSAMVQLVVKLLTLLLGCFSRGATCCKTVDTVVRLFQPWRNLWNCWRCCQLVSAVAQLVVKLLTLLPGCFSRGATCCETGTCWLSHIPDTLRFWLMTKWKRALACTLTGLAGKMKVFCLLAIIAMQWLTRGYWCTFGHIYLSVLAVCYS